MDTNLFWNKYYIFHFQSTINFLFIYACDPVLKSIYFISLWLRGLIFWNCREGSLFLKKFNSKVFAICQHNDNSKDWTKTYYATILWCVLRTDTRLIVRCQLSCAGRYFKIELEFRKNLTPICTIWRQVYQNSFNELLNFNSSYKIMKKWHL